MAGEPNPVGEDVMNGFLVGLELERIGLRDIVAHRTLAREKVVERDVGSDGDRTVQCLLTTLLSANKLQVVVEL